MLDGRDLSHARSQPLAGLIGVQTPTSSTPLPMRFELEPYTTCSFCEDLDGSRDCAFVARNDDVAAIVNERQYERGAMLVIPTRHRESILDITEAELEAVYLLAKHLAEAAAQALDAVGMNVFQNNGTNAGQTEPHFHVHVVPRYPHSDPSRRFQRADYDVISLAEQQAIATLIRSALTRKAGFAWGQMTPGALVNLWVDAFNRADATALAAMYAQDAINHQLPEEPVSGRHAIQAMFEHEFGRARMVCIPERILEDGEWAVLEWKDPMGLRGCGFFRIHDGKMVVQRGYWDKLTFLRQHGLPLPTR
jgi:diadenosine tetraphosphate (Ap4A) HIT family hydrolase/limonene-1,2-epoxide hydrolase